MSEVRKEKPIIDLLLKTEERGLEFLSNPAIKLGPVKFWHHSVLYGLKRIYGEPSPVISYVKDSRDKITDQNKMEIIETHLGIIRDIIKGLKHIEPKSSPMKPTIFLGHGRDLSWSRIYTFIKDDLGYNVEAFESKSRISSHIVDVLKTMLENCDAAVIVMSAEDETSEGTLRARQNVIHEIGLFQGKHGFEKVIVFQQSGIEEFSNITGLQTVRFSSRPEDGFYELERAINMILRKN